MSTVDKDALFSQAMEERDVAVGTLGTVRVRGLSRVEALSIKGKDMSPAKMERVLLSMALIEPTMTEEEVGRWQKAAPAGQLNDVQQAILDMSGMTKDAAKSDVPGDGE